MFVANSSNQLQPESRFTESIDLGEAKLSEPSPKKGLKWKSFSTILRRVGGVVLVSSSLAFLLQQWSGLDSVLRYYSFLGFTLILSIAGFFCGIYLKESKGARTFLSIAALFLPAHFAQLGALIYSRFISNHGQQFLDSSHYLRDLAIYKAPDALVAYSTPLIALLFLAPITYAGFSSMARVNAKLLSALYLGLNFLLLVPTREPMIISVLIIIGFVCAAAVDMRLVRRHSAMRTREGLIARCMMYAPLTVLVTRSLVLYPSSTLILSALFALTAGALFVMIPQLVSDKDTKEFFQACSTIPATLSWILFVNDVLYASQDNLLNYFLDSVKSDLVLPVNMLPVAAIFGVMSFYVIGTGRNYRKIAGLVAISVALIQLFTVSGLGSSLLCILIAIFTISSAFAMEEKGLFYTGIFGLGVGLLYHLRYTADILTYSPWLSLAVIGMLAVITASYIERNYPRIQATAEGFRGRLSNWG